MKYENGTKVRDIITGFEGIITARTDYLNRCVRYGVQPQELHDGKPVEAQWFDEEQVEVIELNAITINKDQTGGPGIVAPPRPVDRGR